MSPFTTGTALLLICLLGTLFDVKAEETLLFTEDYPLKLDLQIDLKALCRKQDQSHCEDVPATLFHDQGNGEEQGIPVTVRARGQWRLETQHCTIPPLFLFFEDNIDGTLFSGQHMLPLTTHCRNQHVYENYVLREYLAYRLYNLLTEKSVRTRLVHISYPTHADGTKSVKRYAFLSEHFNAMADRNGAEILKTSLLDPGSTDPMDLATLELFQFMIGHTDWSALKGHNIVLMRQWEAVSNSGITAVPYDFDFSGLVSAKYAGPPPALPIDNNRQRLYRGICNPAIDWDALFTRFQAIKSEVFKLVESLPGITRSARNSSSSFLESFYEILDSPRRRQRLIIGACRPLH